MSWRESEWGRSCNGVCLQDRELMGGGRIMGAEASVHNKLAEV